MKELDKKIEWIISTRIMRLFIEVKQMESVIGVPFGFLYLLHA